MNSDSTHAPVTTGLIELAVEPPVPIDEWERKLFAAATDCGVSLSDEALSRENLYD